MTNDEPTRRTTRLSVSRSELRGGEDVVHIFGMPSRIHSAQWGPATRALWERLVSTAREHRSTELDIDEWEAAVHEDQAREQDQPDQ